MKSFKYIRYCIIYVNLKINQDFTLTKVLYTFLDQVVSLLKVSSPLNLGLGTSTTSLESLEDAHT